MKKEVNRKTDRRKMTNISPSNIKKPRKSDDNTRAYLSCYFVPSSLSQFSVFFNPLSPNSDENEIFSLRYHYLFKQSSDENKENDYQEKDVLIFRQIILTSSMRYERGTLRRR